MTKKTIPMAKHKNRHTTPRVVAHLPHDLHRQLVERAAAEDRPLTWLIKKALTELLNPSISQTGSA